MKVSICIPTYNQTIYLSKALNSILDQDFNDYEIIITDDTPDDSVKRLIDKFDFNGRLKYFKNSVALGSPENWNEAIKKASGEYIKILHHDDFFSLNTSLGEFVKMLDDHPEAGFAFSSSITYDKNLTLLNKNIPSKSQIDLLNSDSDCLFFGAIIGSPSTTIFRNGRNLFFDKRIKWLVDSEFYIRCLRENTNFAFNDRCLVSIIAAEDRVTNQCYNKPEVEIFELLYVLDKIQKKNISDLKFLHFLMGKFIQYKILGKKKLHEYYFSDPVPLIAQGALISARIYHPFYFFKKRIKTGNGH
jgi:glycosyltransferase involved in cell wall biosynthesis